MRAHTRDLAYHLSLMSWGATASERDPRRRLEAELPQVTHDPMNEKNKMFVVIGA